MEDACRGNFRYGFPLPTTSRSSKLAELACPVSASSILHCTAPYAKVSFSSTSNPFENRIAVRTCVCDKGLAATLVLCGNAEALPEAVGGTVCEFIAISEADIVDAERVSERLGESTDLGSPWEVVKAVCGLISVSFYNVLWIEWVGDIAYRKALGMMNVREFDALGAQIRTTKLG